MDRDQGRGLRAVDGTTSSQLSQGELSDMGATDYSGQSVMDAFASAVKMRASRSSIGDALSSVSTQDSDTGRYAVAGGSPALGQGAGGGGAGGSRRGPPRRGGQEGGGHGGLQRVLGAAFSQLEQQVCDALSHEPARLCACACALPVTACSSSDVLQLGQHACCRVA